MQLKIFIEPSATTTTTTGVQRIMKNVPAPARTPNSLIDNYNTLMSYIYSYTYADIYT